MKRLSSKSILVAILGLGLPLVSGLMFTNAQPAPTPAPSPTGPWSQLEQRTECSESESSTLCSNDELEFVVRRDGTFTLGEGAGSINGQLAPEELQDLTALASNIADDKFLESLTCDTIPELDSDLTTSITLNNRGQEVIYSLNDEKNLVCFNGSRVNSAAINGALLALSLKYAGEAAERPSPSPSPSATPEDDDE